MKSGRAQLRNRGAAGLVLAAGVALGPYFCVGFLMITPGITPP